MSIAAHSAIDPTRLRQVFAAHPSGVTAVAALIEGQPHGLVASTFTAVSLEPALVSVCIARSSTTWPKLREASHLGLSVLSSEQHHVGRALSGPAVNRFDALEWQQSHAGAILLHNAAAWFETTVHDVFSAGDHDIVVLRVRDLSVDQAASPLIFHGSAFRKLA